MKKTLFAGCLLLGASLHLSGAQDALETAPVTIVLQVFDGNRFVNNLGLSDLSLFENGQEMTIGALRLIEGSNVSRTEGEGGAAPQFTRNMVLDFQATEYNQKMDAIVEHFFKKVLRSGDQVALMTPVKSYRFSRQTLQGYTQEQLVNAVLPILKRDIFNIGMSHQDILNEMIRSINALKSGEDTKNNLMQFRQSLVNLENLKKVDIPGLIRTAEELKKQSGRNLFYLFYQQGFRPVPDRDSLEDLRKNRDIAFEIGELFETDRTDEPARIDEVLRAYSDAGITVHFIYFQKNPRRMNGLIMREHSGNMFNMFSKLAKATGGEVMTTATPESSFRLAAESAESYYLVSYTPTGSQKDGTFKSVEIRPKNKGYRVMHRMGYYDN